MHTPMDGVFKVLSSISNDDILVSIHILLCPCLCYVSSINVYFLCVLTFYPVNPLRDKNSHVFPRMRYINRHVFHAVLK